MRLLLDQGISVNSMPEFVALGYEVKHANSLGEGAIPDEVILANAIETNAIVVTSDSDFHAMLAHESLATPSVIRIRIEGLRPPDVAAYVHQGVRAAQIRGLESFAMSIAKDRIAMRALPLR
ncbi:MAG: DUF5615 family PIN-like protein [Armatimonadota bacterium]